MTRAPDGDTPEPPADNPLALADRLRLKPGELLTRDDFTPERLALYAAVAQAQGLPALMSEEAREANRAELLARVAPGADVWVFGYGSLMWNPALHVAESRAAALTGWRRSFCLKLELGRGSPETPGLMLALDTGGRCFGVAHRIAPEHVESETRILWMREMLTGAYTPVWTRVDIAGAETEALAFVINHAHPRYEGELSFAQTAHRIAAAEGHLGTNRDYLYRTAAHLAELGDLDDPIHALAAQVRRLAGE